MNVKTWKSATLAVACSLALSACASMHPAAPLPVVIPPPPAVPVHAPPPAPKEVIVKVPVPVKEACVPKTFPRAPKYPDSDAALRDAGGAADRYQLMAAGRLLRDRRLAELEKQVDACR
jgi:hypothetical protein